MASTLVTGDVLLDERDRESRLVIERSGARDDRAMGTAVTLSSLGHVKSDGILNEAVFEGVSIGLVTYSAVHSRPCFWRFSISMWNFFFSEEFQWFLMELSDRPLKYLAISAHLLPKC
jgi:hypothetical protein